MTPRRGSMRALYMLRLFRQDLWLLLGLCLSLPPVVWYCPVCLTRSDVSDKVCPLIVDVAFCDPIHPFLTKLRL